MIESEPEVAASAAHVDAHAVTDGSIAAAGRMHQRFYPEVGVGGFSHVDGTIAFYNQLGALLRPHHRLLDFGAGRGEPIADDPVPYRRALQTLKGRVAHVEGADVDPVVLHNPYVDHATLIEIGKPLPFPDASFDIVIARSVLEHVDTPELVADEVMRVLKPGGWFCATTPNKWGYVAIGARLVPNAAHSRALTAIQPGRKAEDVFPTRYRMNTGAALRRLFGRHGDVHILRYSAEPAYTFGSPLAYRLFKLVHKLTPDALATHMSVFVRKFPATGA